MYDQKSAFLKGKKILFIGIGFYDYEEAIVDEMKKCGADVTYKKLGYDNFEIKLTRRIKHLMKFAISRMNKRLLQQINDNFDYVFVIKGDMCNIWFLEKLRQKMESTFIMYQWDSINRVKNFEENRKFFDYIYTFDKKDSLENKDLLFRPLFFRNEFDLDLNNSNCENDIDIYSISQFYDYRYELHKKIRGKYPNYKLVIKLKIGVLFYLKTKILRKITLDKDLVIYRTMTTSENFDYMKKSKAILDVTNPIQSGLTMRTLEAIGMKKKLITTNKDITNYEFYNSNNIYVLDENVIIDDRFLNKPYDNIDESIRNKYTLNQWIRDIFIDK